jgi:hypothetical protein
MLTDVLRDAWQQYRRHPLALVPAVALQFAPSLDDSPWWVLLAVAIPQFALALLVSLFLIAWLAGAVDGSGTTAGQALRMAFRSFWRAVPVALLSVLYVTVALELAGAMLGEGTTDLSDDRLAMLAIGSAPLVVGLVAFLAVSVQPVVLDKARPLTAIAISHRVAWSWFGICLLLTLPDGLHWALDSQELSWPLRIGTWIVAGVLWPFTTGMANALYLRTRVAAEPEPADQT